MDLVDIEIENFPTGIIKIEIELKFNNQNITSLDLETLFLVYEYILVSK